MESTQVYVIENQAKERYPHGRDTIKYEILQSQGEKVNVLVGQGTQTKLSITLIARDVPQYSLYCIQ